eukprot:3928131-Amphidinium_carterae.3
MFSCPNKAAKVAASAKSPCASCCGSAGCSATRATCSRARSPRAGCQVEALVARGVSAAVAQVSAAVAQVASALRNNYHPGRLRST